MNEFRFRWRALIVALVVCLACPLFVAAADVPNLTKEQIKQFLLTAKVVKSKQSSKGITNPWRLTLTDGTVTHDALSSLLMNAKPACSLAPAQNWTLSIPTSTTSLLTVGRDAWHR